MELKTNCHVFLTREFRRFFYFGFIFISTLTGSFSSLLAGVKTGADFLKIPIGAEATSVGQAYSALSYGPHALNWNPAGLSLQSPYVNQPSYGASFSHQEQFIETSLDQFGVSFPASAGRWTAGFSVLRLSYGDQAQRNENREVTGSFGASDMSIGMAFARNFGSMQVGSQIKFIRMDLAGYESQGVALDLGLLSKFPDSRLSWSATAKNIGPKMKFISEEFSLPLTFSIGTAFHVTGPLLLSCDLQTRPYQNQTGVSIGSQFMASKVVVLRAGYLARIAESITNNQQDKTDTGSFAGINGLAGGLGIRLNQFTIDYSITPFGELGNTQSLTLSTWFGGRTAIAEPDQPEPTDKLEEKPADDRDILILPPEEKTWWQNLAK